MNILLVDDDQVLAKGTAKLIQRLGGHQVYIADDPVEIFYRCQIGAVDLILMDVNLPGAQWKGQAVSGADLARLLKNHSSTAHIPIILVTAYAMLTEQKALLVTSQADGFYTKPITDYDALLNAITQLCGTN
ncbi:response regulator [Trichocoleus sp. FACHB-262]|uniref:response regulator n=1 Tax=Trichocoleus sp. FACHB-262 TaxID=2692869 RepID=UPI0016881A85|nr:response regulator [Trichocoleus sp. FACHB-262]MBD2123591.1 response regulator [Trichocoleus sp. FACHB-262]